MIIDEAMDNLTIYIYSLDGKQLINKTLGKLLLKEKNLFILNSICGYHLF